MHAINFSLSIKAKNTFFGGQVLNAENALIFPKLL